MKVTGWTFWEDPKYIDITHTTMKERCEIIAKLNPLHRREELIKLTNEQQEAIFAERSRLVDSALKEWYEGSELAKIEDSLDEVVISELRKHNYHFTGSTHQNYDYGCPIIDDKYIYCVSQRSWGRLMYLAFPEEDYSKCKDGYEYVKWAWTSPDGSEIILPHNSGNKSEI